VKLVGLLVFAMSMQAETWTYWAQPCTPAAAQESACAPGDPELAGWALDAWAAQSSGRLQFKPAASAATARLLVEWVSGSRSLYGETREARIDGRPVAVVSVLPPAATPQDPLLREAIVYLTCLHESGHALGLPHTARFSDIMYSFQFGGDIREYFARYRRLLQSRADIRSHSGISAQDRAALLERYSRP